MRLEREALVLWEDSELLAVNKPPGITTLSERNQPGTGLLEWLRQKERHLQACHRLDKFTSGVLLLARNPEAYRNLAQQFEERTVSKVYHALVNGIPSYGSGVAVTAPLAAGKSNVHRVDFAVGKPAETRLRLERAFRTVSLIAAKPITGRSHQIRLHTAYTGHSIVGDHLYGGTDLKLSDFKHDYKGDRWEEKPLNHSLLLHALSLTFSHPTTGLPITLEAPVADNFANCLKILERWGSE